MRLFRTGAVGTAAALSALTVMASGCGGGPAAPAGAKTSAGNGIAAKPAAQIVKIADTELQSAKSVHMYGAVTTSKQRYNLDLTMAQTGAKGSMAGPIAGTRHASFNLVVIGSKMYVRSRTLWRQVGGAGAASTIGDRWVLIPNGSATGFPFANMRAFANLMKQSELGNLSTKGAIGRKSTVHGQPAIEIKDSSDALYVATTGAPYPLEIRQGASNVLYFQYFKAAASITAPPNAMNLSKLQG